MKQTRMLQTGLLSLLATASVCGAQGMAGLPAGLDEKVQKVRRAAESRAQTGQPPVHVFMTMQRVEPLIQEGKTKDAEELVDRALKMLDEPAGSDPIEKKMAQVQKAMKARKSDIPPIHVVLLMKRFESSVKEGKEDKAEEALDQALKAAQAKPGQDKLEKKVARVQKAMKDVQASGGDPMLVGMAMSGLQPALEKGDERGVETTLDTALKLAQSKDPRNESEAKPYLPLMDKMKEVQEKVPQFLSSGGDESQVKPLLDEAGKRMGEGRLDEAGKKFDEVLRIVAQKPETGDKSDEGEKPGHEDAEKPLQ